MAAVWMRFRWELRSRWRAWLTLAVLVGVFGGAVVAAAAGARRTDSVVDRFVAKNRPPNVLIAADFGIPDPELAAKLSLPHLLEFDSVGAGERVLLFDADGGNAVGASEDPALGTTTFPVKLLEGRLPDPRHDNEALANVTAAEKYRLKAGDTYMIGFSGRRISDEPGPPPPGPRITFRITGIVATLSDFTAIAGPTFTVTPAFLDRYGDELGPIELAALRLKHGTASYDAFAEDIRRVTQGQNIAYTETGRWKEVRDSFGLQAAALWILAGLLAALTLLVAGQAIGRQIFLESTDNRTLTALGLRRGQLIFIAILRATCIGLVGAVIGILVAAVASPLTPFGTARLADPDPAFSFPAVPMGLGFGAIIVAVIAVALYPAFRTTGRRWDADVSAGTMRRPHRLVGAFIHLTRHPARAIGARMAFERGRGRTAVPVRTTIVATAICLAAFGASLIVGASLDRITEDPSLYGWTWDSTFESFAFGDTVENPSDGPVAQAVLRDIPGVAAATFGPGGGTIRINGVLTEPFGLPLDADVRPPILDGRAPSSADEIAVGRQTLRDLGVRLGDTVRIGFQGGPSEAPFRVVGVTVLPFEGGVATLGEGVWIPTDGLETLVGGPIFTDRALVRFEPGADVTQLERFISVRFESFVLHAESPGRVLDFGRVSQMPLVLAAIVAMLAAGTLGHGLVTAIHRRRRDLSILKALGFDRRQVRSAVSWQATATTALTVAIGLSLGVVVGRRIWIALAENTGFVARPIAHVSTLALAASAALVAVNLLAILPGRSAARTHPAVVLRTE